MPQTTAPPHTAVNSNLELAQPEDRSLVPLGWRSIVIALTVVAIVLVLNQVFFWNLFGYSMLQNTFLYFCLACFLPIVFILFPARKGMRRNSVPWYDAALAAVTFATTVFLGISGEEITVRGWDYFGPLEATFASFVLWAVVLEALRRTAGLIVTLIALAFSLYPLIAGTVPIRFLEGIPFTLPQAARIHAMGVDSILGLPLQTAASILVGFLLFGVALQHSGGALFFYDIAMSLFGKYRGGSAKVSVVSSAAMGMMSGSAVSNVLTTGPMTIPAMKRSGFTGKYAAGIEATAATGGTITPPIMGTAAFLMVSFVGVPYGQIALAAAIPALLYYWGIFLQVDAHSAKTGLRGMPRAEVPRALPTLASGWVYMMALIGLIVLLVVQKNESQAPFWIVLFLLIVMLFKKDHRLTFTSLANFLFSAGKTIAEIFGIIAGVGLIVGGLSMTGVSLSLARELVNAVGESLFLILIAGAITSFVLGMGMTVSAVYVLLAIVMAPALTALGVNPIAAHLFVIYWATVSYITPPVALASFAAANIAGTPPMATSLMAMRLGAVKYIIPFAFALNPALIAQGELSEILRTVLFALIGIYFLASAFEGFLTITNTTMNVLVRLLAGVSGLLMLWPNITLDLIGLGLGAATLLLAWFTGNKAQALAPPDSGPPQEGTGTVTSDTADSEEAQR